MQQCLEYKIKHQIVLCNMKQLVQRHKVLPE